MITIFGLLIFIASYMWYYTSKKAALYFPTKMELWINQHPKPSKIMGSFILLTSYCFLLFFQAIGVTTLIFFIFLMTCCCLIILLQPLKKLSFLKVVSTGLLIVLLELLCF